MIHLCPRCGAIRTPRDASCPDCGFDLAAFDRAPFDEKLLMALFHPESQTALRAAVLLGRRQPPEAAVALERRYRESDDPYLQRAIVEALVCIGGEPAARIVRAASRHPSVIVRQAAQRCRPRRGRSSTVSG
jgi:HEAT repeat protein